MCFLIHAEWWLFFILAHFLSLQPFPFLMPSLLSFILYKISVQHAHSAYIVFVILIQLFILLLIFVSSISTRLVILSILESAHMIFVAHLKIVKII